jgi:hypothetical protein
MGGGRALHGQIGEDNFGLAIEYRDAGGQVLECRETSRGEAIRSGQAMS